MEWDTLCELLIGCDPPQLVHESGELARAPVEQAVDRLERVLAGQDEHTSARSVSFW